MSPRVSVIVPVYNAADYVEESLQSVFHQTLPQEQIELIVVDDGSTDGSSQILAQLQADHRSMTLVTQPNSGAPGGARNPGLDRASGDFVFFLDADDYLAPDALRRMIDVAEDQRSDVVLGKAVGAGGRRPPAAVFRETVLDAPLLESGIFGALAPYKLFRRSLIERLELRFPTQLQVGEDQSFVATLYLTARKISILADMDYYFVRLRADGGNISRSAQPVSSHFLRAALLARVVEKHTEPGELRDGLLMRPFGRSMEKGLQKRWLSVSSQEQEELAASSKREIGDLYTEGVRRALSSPTRTKLDLLFAGDLDGLRQYVEFEASGGLQTTQWRDGAFRFRMPDALATHLDSEQTLAPEPTITIRLDRLSVTGMSTRVRVALDVHSFDGDLDQVTAMAVRRQDDEVREFELTIPDPDPHDGVRVFEATLSDLALGVWDVWVRVRIGDFEKSQRIGRDRLPGVDPDGDSNQVDAPERNDSVIAYFTKGRGHLAIDRGAILHRNADRARVLGFSLDENAHCVALVQTRRAYDPADEYFALVDGVPHHAGKLLLPVTQFGQRLIGLRLPFSPDWIGGTFTLTSVLDGARSKLSIEGTEYWSSRTSGYGLAAGETGEVRVVASVQQSHASSSAGQVDRRGGLGSSPLVARVTKATRAIAVRARGAARRVRATGRRS